MISFIKGRLVEKTPTYVILETGGIGYYIHISLHTFTRMEDSESVMLYTHFHIREDTQTLFGFIDETEREVFRQLISVSGVGTATARVILSSMSPEEISGIITSGDAARLKSVKGIGAKTAQRIIIDLKDKIGKTVSETGFTALMDNTIREETLSALDVLGFSRKQSGRIVDMILRESPQLSVQDLIKQALKKL
jgi:Holliday junction DNA helicase RuvA